MQIGAFLITLLVILSIIPSLIVAVVLFLRQEAMRQDIKTAVHSTALVERDHKSLVEQTADTMTKTSVSQADIAGIKLRMAAIEESFVQLSNKWNSRMRQEMKVEKRKEKEEVDREDPEPVYEEIPGTVQQALPFPMPQRTNNKRKFGEMPGRM